jgi:hypothetical protein
MNQNIVINQSQSPKIATIIGSKKIIGKSVVIGQNQAPPLVTQTSSSSSINNNQNYIIPINMNSPKSGVKSNEPPALTAANKTQSFSQVKNVIKVNQANTTTMTTIGGKPVLQQSPKFILTAASAQLAQGQKAGKVITVPRNQMLSQQKQILTNVIVQQQKAKSVQNPIILTTNNQQKIPALTISSSNVNTQTSSSSPQFIQIQQPSTSLAGTQPQRQTVYQLKQLNKDGTQQTMILKPQVMKNSSANEITTPPLTLTNKLVKSNTNVIVSSPQIITTTAQKLSTETTNSPVFARVVSAGGRQLIDMPKNTTTFKIAGGNNQQGIIQLSGTTQYAVVSKGKNIVSVSQAQPKIISTQANTSSIIATSSASSNSQNIIISSSNTSVANSSTTSLHQPLKIVQGGSITAQQLLNAKLINVQTLTNNKNIKTAGGIK